MTTPSSWSAGSATPARRRTDRVREQGLDAIALLDAVIAARDADSQVWAAMKARPQTRTWDEHQAMPERRAYLALRERADGLYDEYVAKWPRAETAPETSTTTEGQAPEMPRQAPPGPGVSLSEGDQIPMPLRRQER